MCVMSRRAHKSPGVLCVHFYSCAGLLALDMYHEVRNDQWNGLKVLLIIWYWAGMSSKALGVHKSNPNHRGDKARRSALKCCVVWFQRRELESHDGLNCVSEGSTHVPKWKTERLVGMTMLKQVHLLSVVRCCISHPQSISQSAQPGTYRLRLLVHLTSPCLIIHNVKS